MKEVPGTNGTTCMSKRSSAIMNDKEKLYSAALIFQAPLVQQLSSPEVRLPANFVGIRRIRPDKLLKELKNRASEEAPQSADIVFKIKDDDGNERRMTNKEKKLKKFQLSQERKAAKKRQREEAEQQQQLAKQQKQAAGDTASTQNSAKESNSSRYYELSVNSAVLMQELAELRGERNGLPPVLLLPAMALQAQGVLPGTTANIGDEGCPLVYDHTLSLEWARRIKESMAPAENVRSQEEMRPMPYQLTPEPWKRLRPKLEERKVETHLRQECYDSNDDIHVMGDCQSLSTPPRKCEWAPMVCRAQTNFDSIVSLVFEYLYKETPYYVSCGAKFGSDFLIYDGPREERHAFAGIRVLEANSSNLPIPNVYGLSGFVRCLNTAGKFALLATVIVDQSDERTLYRIAIVDMALEKILSVPTHKKRHRTQKRRDVTANLAK